MGCFRGNSKINAQTRAHHERSDIWFCRECTLILRLKVVNLWERRKTRQLKAHNPRLMWRVRVSATKPGSHRLIRSRGETVVSSIGWVQLMRVAVWRRVYRSPINSIVITFQVHIGNWARDNCCLGIGIDWSLWAFLKSLLSHVGRPLSSYSK